VKGEKKSKTTAKALLTAALCISLFALATSAGGQTVRAGNLIVTIEGAITPKALPRKTPAPVTLSLSGSLKTADATHPPVLKTLHLEFDRHGQLNTTGLPTCRPQQLQSTLTATAERVCKDALVGTGRAEAQIALPEQAPFNASGKLLIFNGPPKGAKQVLVLHVYAHVPAPTTFVTTAVIGKAKGKYGTSADVAIPAIVAGQGSLIAFSATLHKTWPYKGQKQSLLLATCPSGHLYAHGDFLFAGGEELSGGVTRSCTPKG
jgi:hypothetical protein